MKRITVVSGKGGTGKTSIVASLAALMGKEGIVVDADVDAPNLELLAEAEILKEESLFWRKSAAVNPEHCIQCFQCLQACQFGALRVQDGIPRVDPLRCEGCGVCQIVCKTSAIAQEVKKSGYSLVSQTRWKNLLFHARLIPPAENSGKMVTHLRERAEEVGKGKYLLIDGAAGIGCPVIASLTGVGLALMVTEPTLSGLHDLERITLLVQQLKVQPLVVVNRADLDDQNRKSIQEFCKRMGIPVIAEIPFDRGVLEAMYLGISAIEYEPRGPFALGVEEIWRCLKEF